MRKKEIKRGAHAATYLAVWWTLFSAFGVFDWLDARRSSAHSFSYIPFVIWGIHLFLIGLSFYAWKKEQPREVLWIGDEDELLDIDPREIDLEKEKLRSKEKYPVNNIPDYYGYWNGLVSNELVKSRAKALCIGRVSNSRRNYYAMGNCGLPF